MYVYLEVQVLYVLLFVVRSSSGDGSGISVAPIAGAVIGVVIVIALVIFVILIVYYR